MFQNEIFTCNIVYVSSIVCHFLLGAETLSYFTRFLRCIEYTLRYIVIYFEVYWIYFSHKSPWELIKKVLQTFILLKLTRKDIEWYWATEPKTIKILSKRCCYQMMLVTEYLDTLELVWAWHSHPDFYLLPSVVGTSWQ